MTDSNEVPVLARVYRSTVQRISCHLKLFSSYASFILVCDNTRKVYVWVGIASSIDDAALAESVAFNILQDDYQNLGEIVSIREGMEHQQKLAALMGRLLTTVEDYVQLSALRGTVLENVPITLSIIERGNNNHNDDDFILKPLSHSTVGRAGNVLPLPFLSVRDRMTIALLTTGNQYDIWYVSWNTLFIPFPT